MAKKEVTQRESRRNITLSSLERTLIQGTLGSNLAQKENSKYGDIAKNSAANYMAGKEFKKEGERLYKQLSAEYEESGVFGEPDYPSNKVISNEVLGGLTNVMKMAYLEDLYEGVKKVEPGLDLEIPEELREYTYQDVIESVEKKGAISKDGRIDTNKLSGEELTVMAIYEKLRESYRTSVVLNMTKSNSLLETNADLKQIIEGYNKSKEKE